MDLSPFLLFEGNCAEAMRFYQSCLGGELEITSLRDTPMKDQAPASLHDKVVFARLTSGSIELSATDWQHQTRAPRQRNTGGLYLSGGTHADLKEVFDSPAGRTRMVRATGWWPRPSQSRQRRRTAACSSRRAACTPGVTKGAARKSLISAERPVSFVS